MRHLKKFNHLSRTHSHRKAMLSNMATSLIMHKRIFTTLAKAKALKSYVEPLITKSKEDSTHSRRMVFKQLQSKDAVTELFREISVKVAERPGGYTRILKTGNRLGDNADMCMIELVDYNENMLAEKETKKTKTSRRRRGAAKKKTTEEVVDKATDATDEVLAIEEKTDADKAVVAETKQEPKIEKKQETKTEAKKEVIEKKAVEKTPEIKTEEKVDVVKEKAKELKKEIPAEKVEETKPQKDESPVEQPKDTSEKIEGKEIKEDNKDIKE